MISGLIKPNEGAGMFIGVAWLIAINSHVVVAPTKLAIALSRFPQFFFVSITVDDA